MRKFLLIVILFVMIILSGTAVISNAATYYEPESIIYPVPLNQKDGSISYYIMYDGDKNDLQFKQNKSWSMKKIDLGTGNMRVVVTVPYDTVSENFSIPTTIKHQLEVYLKGEYINRLTYQAEFKVPTMRFNGITNRSISLETGKTTVLKATTSKLQLKSNPDTDEAFDYIWDYWRVESSDTDIVEIKTIDEDKATRKIDLTLKGISAGKADITLFSPTKQEFKLATVTVTGDTIQTPPSDDLNNENGIAKTIVYPVPTKQQDGYIEYNVEHPNCISGSLSITQNKDYTISTENIDSNKTKVKIILPYTEIKTNSTEPTIMQHELYVSYHNGTKTQKETIATDVVVPVLKSIKRNGTTYKVYMGDEDKTYMLSSRNITVEPSNESAYEYILKNMEIKSLNENVLKIEKVRIPTNKTEGTTTVYLKGVSEGLSQMVLVTPNNTSFELRSVTVAEGRTYQIQESQYFCKVQVSYTRESVKQLFEEEKEFTIINKSGQVIQETEKIATGMKIKFDDQEYEIAVAGDTNGDGKITITDVAKAQLHFVKLEELTGAYLKAADTNYSADITITDVARLQLAFLGLIQL